MSLKSDFKIAAYATAGMVTVFGAIMCGASYEPEIPAGQAPASISGIKPSTELLDDSTEHAIEFVLGCGVLMGVAAVYIAERQEKKKQGPRL